MDATGGATRALRLGAWLAVAVTGAVMATQAFGWSGTRTVAVLQSLTPIAIVVMAPIAVVASRTGQQRLGFTAALVGMSGVLLAAPVVFGPGQATPRDDAIGVRVAAVNLLYTNDDVSRAADAIRAGDADVIVFTEYTAEHQTVLTDHPLAGGYEFRIDRDGLRAGGIAIWSRYPMREGDRLATRNYSLDGVVDGPDGPFEMFGLHPPGPVSDFDDWRADLALIRNRARAAVGPTLLVGDFNASYWHPGFRAVLAEGFVDAHMAHGKGFSGSWPMGDWRPAFVRLDHALTGRGLVSTEVTDFDVPGSDHRGLVVTVAPADDATLLGGPAGTAG